MNKTQTVHPLVAWNSQVSDMFLAIVMASEYMPCLVAQHSAENPTVCSYEGEVDMASMIKIFAQEMILGEEVVLSISLAEWIYVSDISKSLGVQAMDAPDCRQFLVITSCDCLNNYVFNSFEVTSLEPLAIEHINYDYNYGEYVELLQPFWTYLDQ